MVKMKKVNIEIVFVEMKNDHWKSEKKLAKPDENEKIYNVKS
jgi:hypothetical protein